MQALSKKTIHGVAWRIRKYILRPINRVLNATFGSAFAEVVLYQAMLWALKPLASKRNQRERGHDPLVTVVIPIYNVAKYLEVCLLSVLAQTYRNLRIVLVDDGSTDGSSVIAKKYSQKFKHVKYVKQKNAGLAAARNTGVKHVAHSQFLMFVDSDDVLPTSAVSRYVSAMNDDLDVVVGCPRRMRGMRFFKRHRNLYEQDVAKTNLLESYKFVSDVTAWNKLIRFDFWKANKFKFPDGYLYEDMAVMTDVFAKSRAFGVIAHPVYYWRVRTGKSLSITQKRWEMRNLTHRLKAIEDTQAVLKANYADRSEAQHVWDYYYWSVARFDFQFYLPHVANAGDDYFAAFHECAQHIFGNAKEEFWDEVSPNFVPAMRALVAGDRDATIRELKKEKLLRK